MKLYINALSPNSRKVLITQQHLGLPAELVQVDFQKGEHKSPAFLAINPNGKVPALVDGDTNLWESNSMISYMASTVETSLWPTDNRRYQIMKWMNWEAAHFGRHAGTLVYERLLKPMRGGQPDEAVIKETEGFFRQFAEVLEGELGKSKYLVGDDLTLADITVSTALTYAGPARLPIEGLPALTAWWKGLEDLAAWKNTAPKF